MNEGVYLAEREGKIKVEPSTEGVDIFTGKFKEKDKPGSNSRYRKNKKGSENGSKSGGSIPNVTQVFKRDQPYEIPESSAVKNSI